MRGINDTRVIPVGAVVEPDMLHDDIENGMSTDGVEGERVDCTGGGSMSETGISETSLVLPSINGNRVGGGDGDSIITPLRRSA